MADTYVSSGTVTGQTVGSGNTMYVLSSGTADFTVVSSGGAQTVYSGGVASYTAVDSAGALYVSGGGSIYAATLLPGGYLDMGGTASGVMLSSGFEVLYGTQSGTTIYDGGEVNVFGTDVGVQVETGGVLNAAIGGRDYDATVANDALLAVNAGFAAGVVVGSGGTEALTQYGVGNGTVLSGGTLIVAGGADVGGITVDNGGTVISSGIAIYQGTPGVVVEAPTFTGLIVAGYPEHAYVLAGGTANDLHLYDAAQAQVGAGGTADGAVISGRAFLIAYSGASISGTVLSGGAQFVSGATVYATHIGSGGEEIIAGGAASGSTVSSGGVQYLYEGATSGTTIDSGGTQYVYGFGTGAVTTDSTIRSGGYEFVADGGIASNSTIAGGGILELAGPTTSYAAGIASGSIQFTGSGGQLYAGSANLPLAVISGFAAGDVIDIDDLGYAAGDSATAGTAGTVTISVGDTDYDLNIAGANANTQFVISAGYNGYGIALTENAPCFAAGTRILTQRGEIAVEHLAVGDTVITNTGDDAPIVWIGRRRIDLTRHPRPEKAQPIRIDAGTFGDGVPSRDLLLSPDHALFINDVLIPAKALINNRNIRQLDRPAVTYFHIELAEHSIIFAERTAVETYLETGNRGAFENGAGAIALHPDFAQTLREQQSCAPFTVSGPALEAAREAVLRHYYRDRAARLSS